MRGLRIVAGEFKGRRLKSPGFEGVRPTSERLRETIFAVLGDRVHEARVLDAFAGTGALGLEALSRGARHVTFVEADSRAARLIGDNVRSCGAEGRCAIIRAHFPGEGSRTSLGSFEVILLDPPYATSGDDPAVLRRILETAGSLLSRAGVLVLEHAARHAVPAGAGALIKRETRRAGDSALSLYSRGEPADAVGPADADRPALVPRDARAL